jgi:hypothetical protein
MMAQQVEEPITKLEIDRSKRRINFDECNDSGENNDVAEVFNDVAEVFVEPSQNIDEPEDEQLVQNFLDRVLIPKELTEKNSASTSALGTPTSVLGIHAKNAYTKKPLTREERIEQRVNKQGTRHLRSNRKPAKVQQRNRDLAPNGIKKSTPVKRTSSNTITF